MKYLALSLLVFLCLGTQRLLGQEHHSTMNTQNVYTVVKPPSLYADRSILHTTAQSVWQVDYSANFPDSAKNAVQVAVNIWSYLMVSGHPIKVHANWLSISSKFLAEGSPDSVFRKFPGSPDTTQFYPVALAEALSNSELNGSSRPDIKIDVNSTVAWSCDTNGTPVSNKYDLVSTILHEIAHGLGFYPSFNQDSTTKAVFWGIYDSSAAANFPTVYDADCAVGSYHHDGSRLINSSTLLMDLQGNNIYFDSPNDNAYSLNGNKTVKLYAPSKYDPGSSISHLDSASFPKGTSNSLMEPGGNPAEVIQSPGEVGLGILNDLGWSVARLTTVTSPAPGIVLRPGALDTIKWTDNIGGNVTIDLLRKLGDGSFQVVAGPAIVSRYGSRGPDSQLWTLDTSLIDGDYRIRMWYPGTQTGYGLSAVFRISRLQQVATATFTPPASWYQSAQQVQINCSTTGATIYYTTNGVTPDSTKQRYIGGQYIPIPTSLVLKAIAYKSGMNPSVVASASYSIGGIPAATIAPATGSYFSFDSIWVSWPAGLHCGITQGFYGAEAPNPTSANVSELYSNPTRLSYPLNNSRLNVKVVCWDNTYAFGPVVSNYYTAAYPMRVAQVDSAGASFGQWSLWENSQWKGHADSNLVRPATTGTISVLASRDYKLNTQQKYRRWNANTGDFFRNYTDINVNQNTSAALAHFERTDYPSVQAQLEGISSGGVINVRDPWFLDDSTNSLRGVRNRADSAHFHQVSLPFAFNDTSRGYKGVFLNENVSFDPNKPLYGVRAPILQTILGITSAFVGWDSSNVTLGQTADPTPPGFDQKSVVFKTASARVTAKYKGAHISTNSAAFTNNSQRKFIRTSNGWLHQVYESMGSVWYEVSTDNGSTWTVMSPDFQGAPGPLDRGLGGKCPSIDYQPGVAGDVLIVFQQKVPSTDNFTIEYKGYVLFNNVWTWNSFGTFWTEPSDHYSATNANPCIAWFGNNKILLVWERKSTGQGFVPGLYMFGGSVDGQGPAPNKWGSAFYTPVKIVGSDINSTNPSLAANKNSGTQDSGKFNLAWQQGFGVVSGICYSVISDDNYGNYTQTPHAGPISDINYTLNYQPSVAAGYASDDPTGHVAWITNQFGQSGQPNNVHTVYWDENTPNVRTLIDYGVQSVSLNYFCNPGNPSDAAYCCAYTKLYGGVWSDLYFKYSTNGSHVSTLLGMTGQAIQMSNGDGWNSIYASTFCNTTSPPYLFKNSTALNTYPKTDASGGGNTLLSGRGVSISQGELNFTCLVEGLMADNAPVSFTVVPDSLLSTGSRVKSGATANSSATNSDSLGFGTIAKANSILVSDAFTLKTQSRIVVKLHAGFADSAAASRQLSSTGGTLGLRAELVDATSGAVLGTVSSSNLNPAIPSSLTSTRGLRSFVTPSALSGRQVRVRLNLVTTLKNPRTILLNSLAPWTNDDSTQLAKEVVAEEKPVAYGLDPAYPNPFNPTTVIRYQITEDSRTSLIIYDVLGREVATLANGMMAAGYHSATWNAQNVATGVYFARLVVTDALGKQIYAKTAKLLLMK